MTSIRLTTTLLFAFFLAGCATQPEAIPASYQDSSPYTAMSCESLRGEFRTAQAEYESWAQRQRGARTRDTVLNILILPGLGAAISDHDAGVATAKGKVEAVGRAMASKGC